LENVLSMLDFKEKETVLDGTLGAAGYAKAILERITEAGKLIVLDRDLSAINGVQSSWAPQNVTFCHLNYSNIEDALKEAGVASVDKVVLDLGFSMDQMKESDRGLSFNDEGPLDMRLDRDEDTPTAYDLIHSLGEEDLANVIYEWGEERLSRRIARRICEERSKAPIQTSKQLAGIIERAVGRRGRIHPATRTFQALRMEVNQEMGHLEMFLNKFPSALKRGGRCGIVTFHSIEDRMVKRSFKKLAEEDDFTLVNKKVVRADKEEVLKNPASRSAKLRVIEKN
jgi:16S rRNA (cytosine1402-N4)-methyltransferase